MELPTAPVGDDELGALFGDLLAGVCRVGVAVSGGPDSTALLILLHRFTAGRDVSIHVLTVDHGLRPAARAECDAVLGLAARLGLPASLLVWQHDGAPPAADLQASARKARYRLLAAAARENRLEAVALAHTEDDQAETLLIRLARGSGIRGLSGMPSERHHDGVRFVRPLLGTSKGRLLATLEAAGLPWASDPSNTSDVFLRPRVRAVMPALAEIGITRERLAATARRLARAAAAIDHMVADLQASAATDHGGVWSVVREKLAAAPDEIALRLLAALATRVRPAEYTPRAEALEAFQSALARPKACGEARRTTVAGVVFDPRPSLVWIYAEAGRLGFPTLPVREPGTFVWDGRFDVEVTGSLPAGAVVTAAAGSERRQDLPKAAAASLPVVRLQADAAVNGGPIQAITDLPVTFRPRGSGML